MKLLSDLSLPEMSELIASYGQPKYRAGQLMRHVVRYDGFDEYSDMPKSFIQKLVADGYTDRALKEKTRVTSADGAVRYLFETVGGDLIEAVYLPHDYGNSVCVSCQVGCGMGCSFCASGYYGLKRNLSAGEILSQVLFISRDQAGKGVGKVVMMGSGEPLANYAETVKFIRLLTAPEGLNIGMRSVSLSTCGIVEGIEKLPGDGIACTLSLSLHAATDSKRRKIMRVAEKYTVKQLIDALRTYFDRTGRRVILEYTLIAGFNDGRDDVEALARITKGLCCHVNVIPLNPTDHCEMKAPGKKSAHAFCARLTAAGLSASVRRSMGSDVAGACGQLKNRTVESESDKNVDKKE